MSKAFLRARPRAWWLAAAVLLAPVLAHAANEEAQPYPECTRNASESDVTAAKAAFQAGNVSFNEADYPRAVLYWEDAYRRDCTKHQMLLNLARAYELNGQKRQAVMALETFLAREPNAPDKPQISRRIEVLKKQIDSEQPVAAAPVSEPPATETPVKATSSAPAVSNSGPPQSDRGGSRPLLPLVVAGVGGVMAIGGGILYLAASSEVSDYSERCVDDSRKSCDLTQEEADDANAARSRQTIGGVVAIAGVPVLAGGLVWYFLSPREGGSAALAKPRTSVLPALAPGYTGVSISRSF